MLTLPHPRSGSCSCSRHLRSGSFLPLRNLLRMLRLLPFGCQLRKSYSRRDSWRLQLQRRCWYRSGRCHLTPLPLAIAASYSLLAATLLAASSSLNRGAPAGRRYFSPAGNTSQRAPLRNKEPRPPTAEEKGCCRSRCSCCCSSLQSSAKSNSSFLFSLSFSSAAKSCRLLSLLLLCGSHRRCYCWRRGERGLSQRAVMERERERSYRGCAS